MPIYLYWGDDNFVINQQVSNLKKENLDSNWLQFNFQKFSGDKAEYIEEALIEVMTAPFGSGNRLVLIENTTIFTQCSEDLLIQLQKTLPQIPATTHLLFISNKKPNNRLKSSKLLTSQQAEIKEFSLTPPWQTDILVKKVANSCQEKGIKINTEAIEVLANCVGNDSLLLWQEIEKLAIYQGEKSQPLDSEIIKELVNSSNQNSLQLAKEILNNNVANALQIATDLINMNEPALRIVATLVGQFRTWTIVKNMIEIGEKDEQKIAKIADIYNPKRIYFLKKEVNRKTVKQLNKSLPILLELESSLKLGAEPLTTLKTKIIELCQ